VRYDDLLSVPYLEKGRTKKGMDCYGLVLECMSRSGRKLKDFENLAYVPSEQLNEYVVSLGAKELDEPKNGCLVQCVWEGQLHIGYVLDKATCLHMTNKGARVSPLIALRDKKYFEVGE